MRRRARRVWTHAASLKPQPECRRGLCRGRRQIAPETPNGGSEMTKSRKRNRTGQPTRKTGPKPARSAKAESRRSATPPVVAAEVSSPTRPARPTKKAAMLALLQQPEGAAIPELMSITGWQAHSVRAVLTGFRKDGKELIRAKDDAGLTRYRLSASA